MTGDLKEVDMGRDVILFVIRLENGPGKHDSEDDHKCIPILVLIRTTVFCLKGSDDDAA